MNTEPTWSLAEQLANKLEVIEIVTSLFPRLNLVEELEENEVSTLMHHVNQLVSDARKEATAIMERERKEFTGVTA